MSLRLREESTISHGSDEFWLTELQSDGKSNQIDEGLEENPPLRTKDQKIRLQTVTEVTSEIGSAQ